jgi:hypothetical protein
MQLEIEPPTVLKLVSRLRMVFRERVEERLRPLGVTMAQLQVLTPLVDEPGMSGAQLARVRHVSPQTIHALLMATEERWVDPAINTSREQSHIASDADATRTADMRAGRENRA